MNPQVQHVVVVEGRMVIWRSWLRNSVLPGTIDEDRVTISFNVIM